MLRRRSSGASKKKRMVIKPFKVQPKPPAEFEATTFEKLHAAVRAIHQRQRTEGVSQEELYRGVESLCVHKKDRELYERLHRQCAEHIDARVRALAAAAAAPQAAGATDGFLRAVESMWSDHCNQMMTIRSVFLYLDRSYVIRMTASASSSSSAASPPASASSPPAAASARPLQRSVSSSAALGGNGGAPRSLWDMGLELLRSSLVREETVLRRIVADMLESIGRERAGEHRQGALLKALVRMFSDLKLYVERFEGPFLEGTAAFYDAEGARLIQELNTADYLVHVKTRLHQEDDRVTEYLHPSTRLHLMCTVEDKLVKCHANTIIASGFDALMGADRKADLAHMYFLLSRVDRLSDLRAALGEYVKRVGASIVGVPERDKQMVRDLLAFRDKMSEFVRDAFNGNVDFEYIVKDSFEEFINSRDNKPAELIARFLDARLKSANKGLTQEELEALLGKVLNLFRYIHGKDVFEAFYKKHLAKRLLLGTSSSNDAEQSMIAKLKEECGASFTKKLEGMFRDIENSKEIQHAYEQFLKQATTPPAVDMSVRVLTTVHWPAYVHNDIRLAPDVQRAHDVFRSFYLNKHSGRKLAWQHSLGTAIVKGHFPRGRKELVVSALQATVLLLFNEVDYSGSDGGAMTFQQIHDATGIEEKQLLLTMSSLAHGKARVLKHEPLRKNIQPSDRFAVNEGFKHKLFRIKIPSAEMKETKSEQKKTTEKVFEDRQYAIDACIVRIMKSRKVLKHQQLLAEVHQHLRFPSTPKDVKKRIQSLLEREYLERDKTDSTVYRYLA